MPRGSAMRKQLNQAAYTYTAGVLLTVFLSYGSCHTPPATKDIRRKVDNQMEAMQEDINQIRSPVFVSANNAWFISSREGKLFTTIDGGDHWNERYSSIVGKDSQISFIDSKRGWVISKTDGIGAMWRTLDGGESWERLSSLSSTNPTWSFTSAVQLTFLDEMNGWLIETFSVWRTRDGGANWEQVFSTSDPRVKGQPVRGSFINHNTGWVCGTNGQVYRTVDGGSTWDVQTLDDTVIFTDVHFISKEIGWLTSGTFGQLYRTKDGGRTWQLVHNVDDGLLISFCYFWDEKNGWGVGHQLELSGELNPNDANAGNAKSIVIHTQDGGNSWEPIQVAKNNPLFSCIYFVDLQIGWLCGQDTIYRTKDNGRTWSAVLKLDDLTQKTNSRGRYDEKARVESIHRKIWCSVKHCRHSAFHG
jgi:photosystem II stability/assembly factor-like uncharacterized protein